MYFRTSDKKECIGCTACVNACPKSCISMELDSEGFAYPVIDRDTCVNCGICEKICPVEHPVYGNERCNVYAAYAQNTESRSKSTSGGLFYEIAQWVINEGGIVYGAAFNDNFELKHISAETIEELSPLRGSKYIQSSLGKVFKEIRMQLKEGRWVYFVGVGCQVAGLKSYLQNVDTERLITSDLVCHGVPSQKMFNWHIQYIENKEKGRLIEYAFRDYENWGVAERYKYIRNGVTHSKKHPSFLSPYLYSFMKGLTYRYSCYNCKFAKIPRQGDITLADYWGVEQFFPDLDKSNGVSLILVNSNKGNEIWNNIKSQVETRVSELSHASAHNFNLTHSTPMPAVREYCYKWIEERGFRDVARKWFRPQNYHKLVFKMTIKKFIQKIHRFIGG